MRSLKTYGLFIALLLGLFAGVAMMSARDASTLKEKQFVVVTVKGKILFISTGDEMKRGDVYIKGNPLDFLTKRSRAAIVNKNEGRFVISGNERGKVNMLPAANPISSRSGGLINILDLKKYFDGRRMIIDHLELQIGGESFPQNEENYFYVKYDHKGEVIPKKLAHDGNHLIIDRKKLFSIDGNPIPVEEKEMTLYYKGDEKSYKINKFTPVFPDKEELKEEVVLLFKSGPYRTSEERYQATASFAVDFYGKPDRANLVNWLLEEFK